MGRIMKKRLMRGAMTFNPTNLPNLAAWYDVSDATSIKYDTSNRVSLLSDKSGNSAVNCLVGSSAINNSATVADNSIYTSDIYDVRIDCRAVNWTPSAEQGLIGQYGYSEAQRSWAFGWGIAGSYNRLSFRVAPTGAAATVLAVATENVPFSNLSRGWVRATYIRNTGLGNFEVIFYTSTDGVVWTQLGAAITGASIAATFNSSSPIMIGAVGSVATNVGGFAGNIYRATVATTIGGAPVLDANFALAAKLATSFTESSANAATVTINTSGATGARISGERDLYQGTVANQPVYLPYSGSKYAYLNATSGNFLSSPDSIALDITGDIDLRSQAALLDWTPATFSVLVSKYLSTGSQKSYYLGVVNATGLVRIGWSSTGANDLFIDSTVAPTVTDGATLWVRATLDVDNGAAGRTATFFTSVDGINWTQLGTAVTVAGATSIFSSTSLVNIGSADTGTGSLMSGRVFRAQVYNGINGTLAFDFNAQNYSTGSTLLDASANAATITINGGATIVTAPALYFDGSNDYLKAPPFALSQPDSIQFVGGQVTWTSAENIFDGNDVTNRQSLYQKTSSPTISIFAGTVAAVDSSAFALKTRALISSVFNGVSSILRLNKTTASTGSIGANSANGFTLGASGGLSGNSNITTNEVAIYSVAQSTAQLDQFADYASRKWGFTV